MVSCRISGAFGVCADSRRKGQRPPRSLDAAGGPQVPGSGPSAARRRIRRTKHPRRESRAAPPGPRRRSLGPEMRLGVGTCRPRRCAGRGPARAWRSRDRRAAGERAGLAVGARVRPDHQGLTAIGRLRAPAALHGRHRVRAFAMMTAEGVFLAVRCEWVRHPAPPCGSGPRRSVRLGQKSIFCRPAIDLPPRLGFARRLSLAPKVARRGKAEPGSGAPPR